MGLIINNDFIIEYAWVKKVQFIEGNVFKTIIPAGETATDGIIDNRNDGANDAVNGSLTQSTK